MNLSDIDLSKPIRATMDLFSKLAYLYKCGQNQIIGRYIHTPYISKDNLDNLIVEGDCSLNNARCRYHAPKRDLVDVCYSCPVYIKKVEGTKK
jgi:hypothetical protein